MDSKDTFFSKNHSLNCSGKIIDLSSPLVMGILNLTPDSFYDGGKYINLPGMKERVDNILTEGAAIIDVGAYSSRPGADDITENAEYERLIPGIEYIREKYPDAIISVDTFRSAIARKLVEKYKVDIINDITAGEADREMIDFIADKKMPYLVMHMQGTSSDYAKKYFL